MKRIIFTVLLTVTNQVFAIGQYVNGNTLLGWLQTPLSVNQGYIYIMAISDAEDDEKGLLLLGIGVDRPSFCVPDTADSKQLGDVVKIYLEKNPANRHASAAALVKQAFRAAWSCPK